MPLSTWGGIFFMLMGLGSAWIGIYLVRANRSPAHRSDANARRRVSPTETRLWLIGWTMMGLGFACFGVTVLRHGEGRYVSLPASAPFIDHVIWVLFFAGAFGGFAVLYAWMMVRHVRETRSRREGSHDS